LDWSEFVAEHEGQLEQFQPVAIEDLVVHHSRRHINPAHLGVDAEGEIMTPEHQTAIDGVLLGMIVGVGRKADFASSHDAGTAVFSGGALDSQFTVDVHQAGGDGRETVKVVGDLAYIDSEGPSLTIGRDRGQKEQQDHTDADHVRLAGLHQYVPSLVGQCTLPPIPWDSLPNNLRRISGGCGMLIGLMRIL
jgi:hypothetical protein